MKATVMYLDLSDRMTRAINATHTGDETTEGWSSAFGKIYMNAKYKGEYHPARSVGMLVEVAQVEAADAEDIWVALQNMNGPWGDGESTRGGEIAPVQIQKVRVRQERSMDVGDVIVWEDGKVEAVASCGFTPAEI